MLREANSGNGIVVDGKVVTETTVTHTVNSDTNAKHSDRFTLTIKQIMVLKVKHAVCTVLMRGLGAMIACGWLGNPDLSHGLIYGRHVS